MYDQDADTGQQRSYKDRPRSDRGGNDIIKILKILNKKNIRPSPHWLPRTEFPNFFKLVTPISDRDIPLLPQWPINKTDFTHSFY